MKKNVWLLISLIVVVFLSGAVAGFFGGRLTVRERPRKYRRVSRSKDKMKEQFRKHICGCLKLTDEQKEQAGKIIDEWLEEMDQLRQKHAPQYELVFDKFYNKLLPLLSVPQKVELDKLRKRFIKHKNDDKDNPPPPPM